MIIGITGGFGTGKSTVSKMFGGLGAKVIDADKIVHSFINAKARKVLSKIVFKRKIYLDLICKIIHPIVINKIKNEIRRINPKKYVIIIDAPLLIESGLDKMADVLVVVKAKRKNQIHRTMKRTRLKKGEISKRISFQLPLKEKINIADFVIDNDGKLSDTKRQVREIWERLFNHKKGLHKNRPSITLEDEC